MEAVERSRGQQMDSGTVEKCALGQPEIGDGISVVEAFYIRPVLLGIGRSCLAAPGPIKCHLAVERFGEDLVQVTLLTGGYGAIRQGNSDRRRVRAAERRLDERSPEVEEVWPFSGVFGRRDLPIGVV